MAPRFPDPGEIFEGRYRIDARVGSGGFARIYHAIQRDLERDVALKILKPKPFEDLSTDKREMYESQMVERFRREARNVAQLRDPHTITLYDFGRASGQLFYMVFEYVDGETLKFVTRREKSLQPGRVVGILDQILESLHEAHALGMLHRDIKPANIMLYNYVGRTDQVKVLDFGISKAVLDHASISLQNLTRDDMMMGTPRYMSPEQLRGETIKPSSDIYSLGLVAYELLTAHKAIERDTTVEVINRQISDDPLVLPQSTPIPKPLRATINRMLAKEPAARFQSAQEVQRALQFWNTNETADWIETWANPPSRYTSAHEDTHIEKLPKGARQRPHQPESTSSEGHVGTEPRQPVHDAKTRSEPKTSRRNLLIPALVLAIVAAVAAPIVTYFVLNSGEAGADAVANSGAAASPNDSQPDESAPKAAEQPKLLVATSPESAKVRINGRLVGRSPVEVPRDKLDYPAVVHAELSDGRRLVQTIEKPTGRISLDFGVVAEPDDSETGDDDATHKENAAESEEQTGDDGSKKKPEDESTGDGQPQTSADQNQGADKSSDTDKTAQPKPPPKPAKADEQNSPTSGSKKADDETASEKKKEANSDDDGATSEDESDFPALDL